jgi:hypothetical protein
VRASRGQASVEAVGLAALLLVLGVGLVGRALVDGRGLRAALGRAAVAQAPLGGGGAASASAEDLRAAALALPAADGPAAVAVALLARGIRETSPNFGPAVAIFTDGNAEPWCADFVSYVLLRAGRPFTGGASGGWRIPWVPDIEAWFRARGRWFDRAFAAPLPGDVVNFSWGHTGIVVAVRGAALVTVEGNHADAVATRAIADWRSDAQIVGFGRP